MGGCLAVCLPACVWLAGWLAGCGGRDGDGIITMWDTYAGE